MPITGHDDRSAATLETARLILRPPKTSDADDFVRLLNDFEVSRYLSHVPYPYDRGDAETWINKTRQGWQAGNAASFAITERNTGTVLGAVGVHQSEDGNELGYWLGKAFWGRGYASEAIQAIVAFGFRQTDVRLIHAGTHLDNRASSRVLEKAGFRYVGDQICRSAVRDDFPAHRYELTRAEWEQRRD